MCQLHEPLEKIDVLMQTFQISIVFIQFNKKI